MQWNENNTWAKRDLFQIVLSLFGCSKSIAITFLQLVKFATRWDIVKRSVSVSVNVYLAMVKYTYFLPRYTVLFNTTLEPIHNFEWKKIWIKILNECLEWVFVRSFFFGPDVKISWLSLALFSIVTTKVVTMCPPICVHRGYTHAFTFVYACSCSFIR